MTPNPTPDELAQELHIWRMARDRFHDASLDIAQALSAARLTAREAAIEECIAVVKAQRDIWATPFVVGILEHALKQMRLLKPSTGASDAGRQG